MDKESRYLLQKIDCNCNDCKFMERDFETFNKWKEAERKSQYERHLKNNPDKKEKFQFRTKGLIGYGNCLKFKKPVSFLPNTCNPENQECFKHRKD